MKHDVGVRVELLIDHPEAMPILRTWFEQEWASYYGAGGPGDAHRDLQSFANRHTLPLGLVALIDGQVAGIAALKPDSIASHAHLSPWVAAGMVDPALRGRGIGCELLAGLCAQARKLGCNRIFCGTSTARRLLERTGWTLLENISHEGETLGIYCKDVY
jgi:predicted N-acetyltransferase YhbS